VISVAILADIRLYREGLAQLLDRQLDVCVVATAGNDQAGVQQVAQSAPDVALIDMAMPGSAAIARSLASTGPGIKVLALCVPETESHVLACAEVGIVGYVPREGSLDDLIAALYGVARGDAHYSPRIMAALLLRLAARSAEQRPAPPADRLTRRERQIVELIDQGLTNKEIAERLYIELATVKNHVHNILEKLQIHGRGEAVAWMRAQRRMDGTGPAD